VTTRKPGISRAQYDAIRPPMPLIKNIQPRKMVTARLASGGTIIAARPRIESKNAFEQKRLPVRAHGVAHPGLQIADVVGQGH